MPICRRSCAAMSSGSAAGWASGTALQFMQSNGGLAEARGVSRQGCDPVRPGGRDRRHGRGQRGDAPGSDRLIGFDMGGTSTDVSHYAGALRAGRRDDRRRGAHPRADDADPHRRGGRRIDLPVRRRAASSSGPESPGAEPGPACYRRGGPLTVTDCNLVLGRIDPARFPAVFGPSGDAAARRRSGARGRGSTRSAEAIGGTMSRRGRRARASCDRGRQHGQCDPHDLGRARA